MQACERRRLEDAEAGVPASFLDSTMRDEHPWWTRRCIDADASQHAIFGVKNDALVAVEHREPIGCERQDSKPVRSVCDDEAAIGGKREAGGVVE